MKRFIIFILTLVTVLSFTSCKTNKNTEYSDTPVSPAPTSFEENVVEILPTDNTGVFDDSWSLVDEYPAAIEINDKSFDVCLYVNAPLDEEGNVALDDGQEWALIVTNGDKLYTLFDERIQLGTVNFEVTDYYKDGKTLQGINVLVSTTANFKVVRYELSDDVFIARTLYDANTESDHGVNRRYSTL